MDVNPHPKQYSALVNTATEILYGGAAGGGKSHMMRFLAILLATAVPGLQIYLFRRNYGDLYKNHMEGPSSFYVMLHEWTTLGLVRIIPSRNKIVFWNGATIHLCHLQYAKDLMKYQGSEIHVLLMDELTHFEEKEYRFLRNRVRCTIDIPDQDLIPGLNLRSKLPLIFCGSNPGSIGHAWVKRTFVDYCQPMQVLRTRSVDGGMLRTYVPARMQDNPTLLKHDPGYLDRLDGLGDPALVKAMKDGDWNIVAGGALDDVWKPEHIIVPRFTIPRNWYMDRSFDWGSTHPFSVGWWAESNGEEVSYVEDVLEDNGEWAEYEVTRSFAPGSIIRVNEWYGAKEIGLNEGLKLSSEEIAQGIIERESRWGWTKLSKDGVVVSTRVNPGPADNQIRNVVQKGVPTIADSMAKYDVRWSKSDKSSGSRIIGLELVRQLLKNSVKGERPGMYFMNHCRAAISTLPILPRDPKNTEDVDTKAEDHLYDEVRYRALKSKRLATSLETR
jgi:hypothetical protein